MQDEDLTSNYKNEDKEIESEEQSDDMAEYSEKGEVKRDAEPIESSEPVVSGTKTKIKKILSKLFGKKL